MLDYISISDAIPRCGLRLVLSPGVPGPWSEAAKAIFDIKNIPYVPVAQKVGKNDPELRGWTGQESAPAAMYEAERPRSQWDHILLLAERLAPEPRLVPLDPRRRAEMFGLAHSICGEDGLGWNARLYSMEALANAAKKNPEKKSSLSSEQTSVMSVRYGEDWRPEGKTRERLVGILQVLAEKLHASAAKGGRYFMDDELTALDIYWTTFSTLFEPLPQEHCPMPDFYRRTGSWVGRQLGDAIDPALIAHRDRILVEHFRLPMRF